MDERRLEQKKESWIKNVMKVLGLEREAAEKAYNAIQPYRIV